MSTYGDGGYFFLQPLNTPRQVVSSYGDGGYYFLQPVNTPKQVVSSYGAFHAAHGVGYAGGPAVYVKSADPECQAGLKLWKDSQSNPLVPPEGLAIIEQDLIRRGCLKKSGGGKERPQETPGDKEAASLGTEEQTFWEQYGTWIKVGGGALAALGLGYAAWRALK